MCFGFIKVTTVDKYILIQKIKAPGGNAGGEIAKRVNHNKNIQGYSITIFFVNTTSPVSLSIPFIK
jgi:hypothetical protein